MTYQERHDKMLQAYLEISAWWRGLDKSNTPIPVKAHLECYLDWMENELIDLQRMIDCERATQ